MTVAIIAAYLIGSVPFALLLTRRSAVDVRRLGSGNLGAANVLRASGVRAGVIVAVLDISKGAASVALATRIGGGPLTPALAGLAAIVGHIYPIWLKFKGGKGVATACGVFSVLTPLAVPPALVVFFVTVWRTKYISLGSILATIALPSIAHAMGAPPGTLIVAWSAAALIIFRHRSNVMRLIGGKERRIGVRA
jgi:glycerol-3-phosphate acyltransferase PlsY